MRSAIFLSQGGSAFGRCVLENFAAFFGADFLGNLTDFIDREKFRCGQTAGKEMTFGRWVTFRISRTADGMPAMRLAGGTS